MDSDIFFLVFESAMTSQEDVEARRAALRQAGLHIHFVLQLATEANATFSVKTAFARLTLALVLSISRAFTCIVAAL